MQDIYPTNGLGYQQHWLRSKRQTLASEERVYTSYPCEHGLLKKERKMQNYFEYMLLTFRESTIEYCIGNFRLEVTREIAKTKNFPK